jgi:GTPase SAR1 family protein
MGPRGSGKTTICLRLSGSKTRVPNVETEGESRLCYSNFLLTYRDWKVDVVELGGERPTIHTESYMYARLHGIIYVTDISNPDQMGAAKGLLQGLLNHDYLRGKPCLILGNKGDKLSKDDLEKTYSNFDKVIGLQTLRNTSQSTMATAVISARSLKSELVPAVEWLLKKVHSKYGRLVERSLLEQAQNKKEEEELRLRLAEEAKTKTKSLWTGKERPSYTHSKARAEVIRARREVFLNIWDSKSSSSSPY